MFSYRVDENLELVLPMPQHAEEIAAVVRANLEQLHEWLPWATEDYSVESARAYIKRTLQGLAEDGGFLLRHHPGPAQARGEQLHFRQFARRG